MERNDPIQQNNFEGERIALAERRKNEGDLLGALTVLRNLEEEGTKNINVLSSIAAVYFDMEQFVLSSEYWFRYLSQSNSIKVRSRAYSGLSACFCMLGDARMMAYYSEKGLALGRPGEPEYENVLLDYYDYVSDSLGNGYYVSYPEKFIPPKRLMFEADSLIDLGKDLEAAERYGNVQKESEYYCEARSKMAQCLLVAGKEEDAEKVLTDLIADFPEDNFANLSYGLYLLDKERDEESVKYLLEAVKGEFYDEEDYFRLAAALCRVERESEALSVLDRALAINEYCLHVLYLYAIVTHNLGDDKTSASTFKKIYLMTRTEVSLYYYKLIEDENYKGKLEYSFNLPKSEASKRFAKITLVIANGKKAIAAYGEKEVEALLDWCLPYETKLQFEFVDSLLKNGGSKIRNHVVSQLISPNVSNEMKMFIIETLVFCGSNKKVSVTFDNVFLKVALVKGDFEKTRGDFFDRAYAYCFGRLSPFSTDGYKLRDTAYRIYYKLKDNGYLKKVNDVAALACAMAIENGFNIRDEMMYEAFFHTNKSSVEAVLKAIREEVEE